MSYIDNDLNRVISQAAEVQMNLEFFKLVIKPVMGNHLRSKALVEGEKEVMSMKVKRGGGRKCECLNAAFAIQFRLKFKI